MKNYSELKALLGTILILFRLSDLRICSVHTSCNDSLATNTWQAPGHSGLGEFSCYFSSSEFMVAVILWYRIKFSQCQVSNKNKAPNEPLTLWGKVWIQSGGHLTWVRPLGLNHTKKQRPEVDVETIPPSFQPHNQEDSISYWLSH